jgi:predicted RNA-binding Zn-ribbon protein involved in translation (DUF1610 family)
MKGVVRSKGPWLHRFAIRVLTVVFGLLVFWLLEFVVEDLRTGPRPDRRAIEQQYVDPALVARRDAAETEIRRLQRQIDNQKENREVLAASLRSLEQTKNQMIELQRLTIEKRGTGAEKQQADITGILNRLLEIQKKDQDLIQALTALVEKKQDLESKQAQRDAELKQQRQAAQDQYDRTFQQRQLTSAALQLAVLVPLLGIVTVLSFRKRTSIYFPFFLAFGLAALAEVAIVVHEYFPSRYSKYVLLGAVILAVAWVLVHFIRSIAFPKAQWVLTQYREAYERFLCPVCEYPIRTGPRRYLFWTRRTVKKPLAAGEGGQSEEPYVCPACGSRLWEPCAACEKIRHTMLPHCLHCGAEKPVESPPGS